MVSQFPKDWWLETLTLTSAHRSTFNVIRQKTQGIKIIKDLTESVDKAAETTKEVVRRLGRSMT